MITQFENSQKSISCLNAEAKRSHMVLYTLRVYEIPEESVQKTKNKKN
jgi:hypothetical protein